ncbi:MAG: hypothetical protein AAGB22_10630, partial [Bacteroidota bacterium]
MPHLLPAQDLNNQRQQQLPLDRDTVRLDSMSLVPGSISLSIDGQPVDSTTYTLDPATGLLIWRTRPAGESLTVNYRVFPVDFSRTYQHKDNSRIEPDAKGAINP